MSFSDGFDDDFGDAPEALTSLDYWRLCDDLTVIQAAMLLSGNDPSSEQNWVESRNAADRPVGYEGAKAAISRALVKGSIEGEHHCLEDTDINGNPCGEIPGTIDLARSLVSVESLKRWLRARGISTGFFFPGESELPDFLNQAHPRYSSKLAAAISAWLAIENVEDLKGKSPKQALEKWLRENAAKFNLSDEEGKPNEKGIEECAKVANWKYTGGAPKTPT